MVNMNQFIKERDAALLSLNKRKIMRYARKYGIHHQCSTETVFWAGIHKAILTIESATPEQKEQSAAWLMKHGFKPRS